MRYLMVLISIFMLCISMSHVYCKGSRSMSKSQWKPGSSKSRSPIRSGIRSPGMSLSRKNMLMGAGGLAAAYIGFKLASHNDMSRYTICEGNRYETDAFGLRKLYKYTVCPSHISYCCRDYAYDGERCCSGSSYSGTNPSMLGSIFSTILIVGGIALIVYCCCCRRRKSRMTNSSFPIIQTVTVPAQPDNPPVPVPPMASSKPYEPFQPYSAEAGPNAYQRQDYPVAPYPTGPMDGGVPGPYPPPQYPPSIDPPPYPSASQFPLLTGDANAAGNRAPGSAWDAPFPPPATAPPPYSS